MIIDNAGTYTLRYTATDDCGKTTTVDRELVVAAPIYGAYYNKTITGSKLTRSDSAEGFSDPVASIDGSVGSSPFDDIMPWSGMTVVEDSVVGSLVAIPKYYYKVDNSSDRLSFRISESKQPGFVVSPAHADRGDGVGERDVVYVGKYHCTSDYTSRTGVAPLAGRSKDVFRNGIHNLGSDVWQWDYAMFWTIAMLYIVEFADFDSQTTIGYGCGTSNVEINGASDSIQYHTGSNKPLNQISSVKYRNIEGLWSNLYTLVDGIYYSNNNVYAIKRPSDFSNNSNGVLVANRPQNKQYSKDVTVSDADGYGLFMFPTGTGGYENGGLCDQFTYSSNSDSIITGGAYSGGYNYGIFYHSGALSTNINSYTGSRLMKLPNA